MTTHRWWRPPLINTVCWNEAGFQFLFCASETLEVLIFTLSFAAKKGWQRLKFKCYFTANILARVADNSENILNFRAQGKCVELRENLRCHGQYLICWKYTHSKVRRFKNFANHFLQSSWPMHRHWLAHWCEKSIVIADKTTLGEFLPTSIEHGCW